MDKYIKSESLRSVFYFLLMMGAIWGVQSLNKLFLPWFMLAIYIIIALSIYKIAGGGKEIFFYAIAISSLILFIVVSFTLPRSERGIESYIEHKYEIKQYQVVKCDYYGIGSHMPLRCVVPGYLEAEKEANLIIDLINFLSYFPIFVTIVFLAITFKNKTN